jgi:type I restriction enzyme R subunit
LLDEIIALRQAKVIDYKEYLKQITELTKKVEVGKTEDIQGQLQILNE